jgi:hypothetical protein
MSFLPKTNYNANYTAQVGRAPAKQQLQLRNYECLIERQNVFFAGDNGRNFEKN